MAPPAQAAIYAVKQDGTGNFTTIQSCANAAKAGDTCLVSAGTYPEHVKTVSGGTSDTNRVTFKAQPTVTMQGFDIKHPYVTVDGFDITGYSAKYSGHILILYGGNSCQILNNTVRDGATDVYGILFYSSSGQTASNCIVRGNKLSNLMGEFLNTAGDNHLFENNVFEYQNNMDYVRLFGSNMVFRRNIFWRGTTLAGSGNHPDFVQTFGVSGGQSQNHLFEENLIEDLPSQFSQMNSGDGEVLNGILYDNVKNITFRRNIIANLTDNANIGLPGVHFENNTFYRLAYELSGMGYGGSLTRGDASNGLLKNNIFLAGGSRASAANDFAGYYSMSGALFSKEVVTVFVTKEKEASGNTLLNGPITTAIFADLQANGYIDGNGKIFAKAQILTDISQFVLSNPYGVYKQALYDNLIKTVQLDNSIRSTFLADYNFVAGAASAGFPAKKSSGCMAGANYTDWNFCEPHGINGGDPALRDLANVLGPDGIPFTLDDGLKPLPSSPLCGKGDGGVDIGAYSCDPGKVFPDSGASSDTDPPSIPSGLSAAAVSSSRINLSWTASKDNVGVAGYEIYRNNARIGFSVTNSYSDAGLSPSTSYTYTVAAYDAVPNVSAPSASAGATTLAAQAPPSPFCGDGTCNGSETCSSCPSDCGACSSPPPVTGGLPPFTLDSLNDKTFTLTDEIRFSYPVSGVTYAWDFVTSAAVTPAKAGAQSWVPASAGMTSKAATTSAPQFTPANAGLSPGTYMLTVTVSSGTQSQSAHAQVTLVAANLTSVKVYPNPWRSDKHAGHPSITFAGLTVGTTVKVFTASGHLLKELHTDGPSIAWDLANDSGDKVASGVYLFLITDNQGDKVRGKVAVIR